NADCSGGWCAAGLWAWHLFRNNTGKDEPSAENKLSAEEDPSAEGESSVKLASEDAEFSDLRRVIRAAVTYAHWKPYRQNNKDFTHTAQAILDELQEDSQWPIASWLKARAHFVIGNFDQASALLEPYVSPQPPFVYPPAQILYAQTQFELGMFQKAFDLSETILNAKQAEPDDIERAHITRMYAQAYLANWDLTQPILNDFITANKDNAQTLDVAVSLCSQFGHTDTCQVAFQRILETEPQNPAVLYALSNILISIITVDNLINAQIRKHQPAFDYLKNIVDQAIELTPGNIRLWVYRSLILIAQNDLTGAKAALLEAERDERHAGALRLNEILTAKISNDKTRQDTTPALYAAWANDVHLLPDAYLLSNLLRAHQMYDEASLVIERMRVRYPQNLSLLGERFRIAIAQHDLAKAEDSFERFRSARALTHDHQFQMAILAVSLGDADDALKRMSTLVAQAPNHDDYLFSLGMLYFNRQDFGSAKVYFDRALQIDITNAKYHFYKGRSLYEEKAFNEALLAFNEASRHDESNKEYVFWIGLTLAGLNHYEEALRAFTTVIDTFNARPDADRTDRDRADAAEAHFYRANLNQQRQRRFHAEEDFVAANRLAPLNPRYVQGYATFLFESGKLNAALAEIAKIEAIHGTNLDAGLFFAKGLALLKINKPKEALTAFEIARDKGFAERASTGIIGFKDPAEVYERLGYLYRDFGRKADARQALEKYLNTSQHLSATDKREITLQLERL
ncbi:MAG: tetratricopeptide repeat protein, partial [Proteobacteria bacterium]|nr:tetratricopeptide repeat protein [Pseudomonadota bacterium]